MDTSNETQVPVEVALSNNVVIGQWSVTGHDTLLGITSFNISQTTHYLFCIFFLIKCLVHLCMLGGYSEGASHILKRHLEWVAHYHNT